jgi:AcrR family transcriptional regulator
MMPPKIEGQSMPGGSDPEDSPREEGRCQPKQHRSVETRNSILEAAAALFDEKGYDQTTTHQIAARADVSVGALYRYFSDKQAILVEVYSLEISGLRNRILQEFSFVDSVGKDLQALVRKALEAVFQVYAERPGLRRTLVEQSRKIPELADLRRQQERELYQTVRQVLLSPGIKIRVPDVDVSAYLCSLLVDSLSEDFLLYRRRSDLLEESRVIDGTVDLLLRYVLKDKK